MQPGSTNPTPPTLNVAGSTPVSRALLWVLLGWALVLFATGITWGMPSWAGWAGDELHPTSWTTAISPETPNGWHARYPPMHFALLSALAFPVRWLAGRGILEIDEPNLIVLLTYMGRLVSLVMALCTVYLLYLTGCRIYGRRGALFAAFIAVSVAPYVYYAKMANLDAPYICWFVLSLLFYVRLLREHRRRDYVMFALAAAAAVCTKDQAYGLYLLAPLPIVFDLYRRFYRGSGPIVGPLRALIDRRLLAAGAAGALGFVVFQDLLFDWQRFRIHVRLLLGPMSENYQDYPNSLAGHLELLRAFAKQTAFALNPALTAVCLLGVGLLVYRAAVSRGARGLRDPEGPRGGDGLQDRQNPEEAGERRPDRADLYILGSVVFLIVSYYVTFLNAILFIFDRYVLPVTMILALCGGYFLREMLRPGVPRRGLRWTAAILVGGYSVLYAASVDCRMLADSRYYVEDWVGKHAVRPESVVGVGRRKHIPRFQWIPWNRALRSQGEFLRELQPEYIAINVTDFRRDEEADFAQRLATGELGYRLIFTRQSRPLIDLLGEVDGGSSQRFINPEIKLFGRIAG